MGTPYERQGGGSLSEERCADGSRVDFRTHAAAPRRSFYWLWAAGIYNLVWGLVTIAARRPPRQRVDPGSDGLRPAGGGSGSGRPPMTDAWQRWWFLPQLTETLD